MELFHGDCLEVMKELPDKSIDAIVTDPPYGLSFMGKSWDKVLPDDEIWRECFRVLKPGGYILAMSASRTYHRLAVQLEGAGFITHPMIGWIYGSGFPKATDLSKQFDKAAGAEREVIGKTKGRSCSIHGGGQSTGKDDLVTSPATDLAKQWDGWKYGLQSLKPALEPIFMGQKPHLKPMIKNVEKWGTGAVNIDACRALTSDNLGGGTYSKNAKELSRDSQVPGNGIGKEFIQPSGRHPANLLHDGLTEEWARFFYTAKASKSERGKNNNHPTVKPIKLMEWMVKLITPPNGTVLDPFMGSGSTGIAAKKNNFNFIGIEREKEYFEIAKKRIMEA